MEEKINILLIFIFSVLLSSLFVLPFQQLLGEDPYFHREITEFLVEHGYLPQNNVEEWNRENPYASYLDFKLRTYPRGFYYILYPFHTLLRFFPVLFSGITGICLYLYLSRYSKEAGVIGGIIVHTPNFTAHSILLLPEILGLAFIPFILYLFDKKYYLSGVFLGILTLIHPLSAVMGYLVLIITGIFKKNFRKLGISLLISLIFAFPYLLIILGEKTNVSYQIGIHFSTEIYSLKDYLGFFGAMVISPVFLYLSIKKKDYRHLAFIVFLIFLSLIRISRVPSERFFAYLSIFLAIIVALRIVEIKNVRIRYCLVFSLILISSVQNYWIFGAIGPSTREVKSWEFLNENSLEDCKVLGWERYPQIFTVKRKIYHGEENYRNYKDFDYVSPDANVLVYKRDFLSSLEEDKIYDNKVGIWLIDS